jgi:hypothetical protein
LAAVSGACSGDSSPYVSVGAARVLNSIDRSPPSDDAVRTVTAPILEFRLRASDTSATHLVQLQASVERAIDISSCAAGIMWYSVRRPRHVPLLELPEAAESRSSFSIPLRLAVRPGAETRLAVGLIRYDWATRYRPKLYRLRLAVASARGDVTDLGRVALAFPAVPDRDAMFVGERDVFESPDTLAECIQQNARALREVGNDDATMQRELIAEARAVR